MIGVENGTRRSPQGKEGKDESKYKMITIRNKIDEHDMLQKLNNIKKWLAKGFPVRAVIQNTANSPEKLV